MRFAHLALLAIATALSVACSQSISQQGDVRPSPDDAQNEKAYLAASIAGLPTPDGDWKDSNLAAYQASLARFKTLENMFHDSNYEELIKWVDSLASLAADARAEHKKWLAADAMRFADTSTLIKDNNRLINEIFLAGEPNIAWSEEKLVDLDKKIARAFANAERLELKPLTKKVRNAIDETDVLFDLWVQIGAILRVKSGVDFDATSRDAI